VVVSRLIQLPNSNGKKPKIKAKPYCGCSDLQ
jgi:hypothetical protein